MAAPQPLAGDRSRALAFSLRIRLEDANASVPFDSAAVDRPSTPPEP
jgi:hypothetical protein